MNFNTAIKSLTVASALAFAGCMSSNPEDGLRASDAATLTFARAATVAAVEAVGPGAGAGAPDPKEYSAEIRAFGCPVLADAVEDLGVSNGNEPPASLMKIASCFGVKGKATNEDIDTVWAQLKDDMPGLLKCICGGDALANLLYGTDGGKLSAFSAATGTAASSSFSASGNVGAGYKPSSTAGNGYSSSGNFGSR